MGRKYFKVSTFNLLNLAMPGERYYNREYSKDQFDRKSKWIAEQLDRMDADIIGFQEVFHLPALQKVLAMSKGYGGASIRMGERNGRSPAVALVSRFDALDYDVFVDFPPEAILDYEGAQMPITRFSRPILRAKLMIHKNLIVNVFVCHLKSKRPKIPDGVDRHDPRQQALGEARSLMIRAAEATALRHLLLNTLEGTDHPVIVMGDLNDDGAAVTSQIITGSEPFRRLDLHIKQKIWDVHLYNVKDIQARQSYRDVYYTHIHNGHYDSLDHILVSQEFVRQNPQRLGYVEYVKVFNDHLIDETLSDDRIPLWQSDHGQAVTTIQLEEGIPGVW